MTDYERYGRLREALTATATSPKAAHGGWHHQAAARAMASDWTLTTTWRHWPSSTPPGGPSSSPPAKRSTSTWMPSGKHRKGAAKRRPNHRAYDVVAALRNLFAELVGNAEDAIAEAGDPDPDDG